MLVSRRVAYSLLGVVLAIELGYVLYPALRVFIVGLSPDNFTQLFASSRSANVRALTNSVMISIWTVIGAGILGTALAYLFFRYRFPLRKTLMTLAAVPLALPPLVGVLAFLFLYGESGI
ncbi:MAG: iron ABC transporter permease, partial [Rhodothermales bacterium]|nr:iron ABC transporter permease [Rhodothermales bacterium]